MKRIAIGYHVVEWVAKKTAEFGNFGAAVGIGVQERMVDIDGHEYWQLIAGVAYADWNGPNIVAHIASDGSKRWMTKRFLWTIFDYPFNQAKVNRITCLIGEKNEASIRLCEHFGFMRETALRGAHPDGDLLIYCLRKENCKWLRLYSEKRYALAA